MMGLVLTVVGGYLGFFISLKLLEKDRELSQFWHRRVVMALVAAFVLWKLTPIFTRWDAIAGNPELLWYMNGGLPGLLGALFAAAGFLAMSMWQAHKVRPFPPWPLWAAVALGGVLATGLGGGYALVAPAPSAPSATEALQLTVPDLLGRKHALADWKGEVLVVTFWNTTTLACRANFPEMRAFQLRDLGGVKLININCLKTEAQGFAEVLRVVRAEGLTWTQLTDPEGLLTKAWGVRLLPTTLVFDPKGGLIERREGPVALSWLLGLKAQGRR